MNKATEWLSWTEPLTRRFSKGYDAQQLVEELAEANNLERTRLVAVVRWLLLLVLALYGLLAGSTYLFSRYGFFITREQVVVLVITMAAVMIYNLSLHFYQGELYKRFCFSHLQIVLDLIAVTALIHCSGGATSWFWPVYMIVTLEAAYLLNRQRDVWFIGAAGGGLVLPAPFPRAQGCFALGTDAICRSGS